MEVTHLQRLSFIKYLFSSGLAQSYQPEPICAASILSFHDSVELFLQLSLEKVKANISNKELRFMDYWDPIEKELKSKKLSQKEGMKKLNKIRVDLKHHGIIPSKLEIESCRYNTSTFFNENCIIIFNINFDDISLLDIIKFERPKEFLKQAKKDFEKGFIDKSKEDLALSFEYLVLDYEESKRDKYNRSPFFFGDSMANLKSIRLGGIVNFDPDAF